MRQDRERIQRHLDTLPNGHSGLARDIPSPSAPRRIARSPAAKLSGALFGLLLVLAAPGVAFAGGDDVAAARPADIGYADRIAPLRAAAKNNDVRAQETLGLMYLCAESPCAPGIARDLDEAHYWLSRAAARGSLVAAHRLARMRGADQPTLAVRNP
jgi:TPR repeat protein